MDQVLLLVSGSKGRAELLRDSGIPFEVVEHRSKEDIDRTGLSHEELVCRLALDKMEKIIFPDYAQANEHIFALSADTIVLNCHGEVLEKPKDKDDAIRMLKSLAEGPVKVFTGCCLRKFRPRSDGWLVEQTKQFYSVSEIMYSIPEHMLEKYFSVNPDFLKISSAATIEGYGSQFTKWVKGSYSSIQGIPMFEMRQELEAMGFFKRDKEERNKEPQIKI